MPIWPLIGPAFSAMSVAMSFWETSGSAGGGGGSTALGSGSFEPPNHPMAGEEEVTGYSASHCQSGALMICARCFFCERMTLFSCSLLMVLRSAVETTGAGGRRADDDRPMRSSSYEYEYSINKNTNTSTVLVLVRGTLLGPLLRFYILL